MPLPHPLSSPRLRLRCGLVLLLCLAGWLGGSVTEASAELLVISGVTNQVKSYNETTGAFIGNFTSAGGIGSAVSLTFGPDGNLYVGSFALRVNRYNGTTGVFIDVFASGMDEALGVVFGKDGQPLRQQQLHQRGEAFQRDDGGLHRQLCLSRQRRAELAR